MEGLGPVMCDYELWDLYAEEIGHVTNTLLVRAGTLVMRGNNAAKKHANAAKIGIILSNLIPKCIQSERPPSPTDAF
eukprot:5848896-Pyramimonas_sp.AAC.1